MMPSITAQVAVTKTLSRTRSVGQDAKGRHKRGGQGKATGATVAASSQGNGDFGNLHICRAISPSEVLIGVCTCAHRGECAWVL
jgi:hypothetical protein